MANAIGPVTRRLPALVVESCLSSCALRRIDVGRGLDEFQSVGLLGIVERRGVDLELGQRAGPIDRSARPAVRQVGIVQQFEPERGDLPASVTSAVNSVVCFVGA